MELESMDDEYINQKNQKNRGKITWSGMIDIW